MDKLLPTYELEEKFQKSSKLVLIAVCTLGINANLLELVDQLIKLRRISVHQIRIVVVLNSERDFKLVLPSDIEIHLEPVTGYSSARNKALNLRRKEESIWFIDDDELLHIHLEEYYIAENDIIKLYLNAALEYPNCIFVGPYLPVDLDGKTLLPEWKNIGRLKSGDIIDFGSGGNLFLPQEIFKNEDISFDSFFNFGGEDTCLVRNLSDKGVMTRWISSAILFEKTPRDRYSLIWQNDRNYKNFLINVLIEIDTSRSNRIKRFRYGIELLLILIFRRKLFFTRNLKFARKLEISHLAVIGNREKLRCFAVNGLLHD